MRAMTLMLGGIDKTKNRNEWLVLIRKLKLQQ